MRDRDTRLNPYYNNIEKIARDPIEEQLKNVGWIWAVMAIISIALLVFGACFLSPTSSSQPTKDNHLTTLSARQSLQEARQDALIKLTESLRQDINNRRYDDISQHRRPLIEDMIPAIWKGCGAQCHDREGE